MLQAYLWLRMSECCLGIFHDYVAANANCMDSETKTGGPVVTEVLNEKE